MRYRPVCRSCPGDVANDDAERWRLLRWLALLEQSEGLPEDLALRLGAELLIRAQDCTALFAFGGRHAPREEPTR